MSYSLRKRKHVLTRRLPETNWRLPETIWRLPETIWIIPETIWRLPETYWWLPDTNWLLLLLLKVSNFDLLMVIVINASSGWPSAAVESGRGLFGGGRQRLVGACAEYCAGAVVAFPNGGGRDLRRGAELAQKQWKIVDVSTSCLWKRRGRGWSCGSVLKVIVCTPIVLSSGDYRFISH